MHNTKFAKEILEFQKSVFDNGYNTLLQVQTQAENLADMMLMQTQWMPEEGKRLIDQWTQALKKGQKDLKAMADQGYDTLKTVF
jgi:hypothetical protein